MYSMKCGLLGKFFQRLGVGLGKVERYCQAKRSGRAQPSPGLQVQFLARHIRCLCATLPGNHVGLCILQKR